LYLEQLESARLDRERQGEQIGKLKGQVLARQSSPSLGS
jgi:hypothetical protein